MYECHCCAASQLNPSVSRLSLMWVSAVCSTVYRREFPVHQHSSHAEDKIVAGPNEVLLPLITPWARHVETWATRTGSRQGAPHTPSSHPYTLIIPERHPSTSLRYCHQNLAVLKPPCWEAWLGGVVSYDHATLKCVQYLCCSGF